MLLAGPEISSRLQLQLATRIDEVASRRRMHGSLRFRSAQELADRLVVRFPVSQRFVCCLVLGQDMQACASTKYIVPIMGCMYHLFVLYYLTPTSAWSLWVLLAGGGVGGRGAKRPGRFSWCS